MTKVNVAFEHQKKGLVHLSGILIIVGIKDCVDKSARLTNASFTCHMQSIDLYQYNNHEFMFQRNAQRWMMTVPTAKLIKIP